MRGTLITERIHSAYTPINRQVAFLGPQSGRDGEQGRTPVQHYRRGGPHSRASTAAAFEGSATRASSAAARETAAPTASAALLPFMKAVRCGAGQFAARRASYPSRHRKGGTQGPENGLCQTMEARGGRPAPPSYGPGTGSPSRCR